MAGFRRGPSGAALVVCAPPLARIHERIFQALDLTTCEGSDFGRPGGSGLLVSDHGLTNEVELFALPYFGSEWLSKLDDGKSSSQKVTETWNRFHKAEASCFETNQKLARDWRNSPYAREINLARKIVSRVLGKFDWDQAARGFRWSKGATTRLTRRESDAAHKYSGTPHSTIGNAVLANTLIEWTPGWAQSIGPVDPAEGFGYVKIVDGNRVVTVPKNYKTDRTIAIEPDMNIHIQLGIGAVIRSKLRGIGVNLDDQTRNQRMAHVGSFTGSLATIDLSMASDTISRSVVELLVRPDWLEALGQCRSPFGVLPSGEKIFYQKYSSMGNGYTFELESLLFSSLAFAYAHLHGEEVGRICVYGDDIIVPSTMAPAFCGLLEYLGFTPNEKKSYWTGDFRESCGKHYFRGYDITPFYVKQAPKKLIDLFKIHNQLWRFVDRSDWLSPERKKKLLEVCSWLRTYSPASWRRPSIVDGLGDGAFVGYFDEVTPQRASRGWDGYLFKSIVTVPIPDESYDSYGLMLKSLDRLERGPQAPPHPSLTGKEPPDMVEVLPIKKQRYVATLIFQPSAAIRRQCTGLLHP